MSNQPANVPPGYHTVTPYLTIDGAGKAIDFYTSAFGAKELSRMAEASGKIGHAELQIGDSRIMLSDEYPEWGALAPGRVGGTPCSFMIYMDDPDEAFERALKLGAKELMPMSDQFYGDRCGKLEDPYGHRWSLAKRVEELSDQEIARRSEEQFGMTYTTASVH